MLHMVLGNIAHAQQNYLLALDAYQESLKIIPQDDLFYSPVRFYNLFFQSLLFAATEDKTNFEETLQQMKILQNEIEVNQELFLGWLSEEENQEIEDPTEENFLKETLQNCIEQITDPYYKQGLQEYLSLIQEEGLFSLADPFVSDPSNWSYDTRYYNPDKLTLQKVGYIGWV